MSRQPKVFISYSWTSAKHQTQIKEWADRLAGDGVDIVFDLYDLKEGADKYVFMERMIIDASVTHVLVFLDKTYAEKADARLGGAGTESQIISSKIYESVDQDKFIPIVCERDEAGEPYKPIFFKSRIHIDFSTVELAAENWEKLIRLLHGKPLFAKPSLGKPPAYLSEESAPANPASFKFRSLTQSVLNERRSIESDRHDFLDANFQYIDDLRVRKQPDLDNLASIIVDTFSKLKSARNLFVDWVLLEGREGAPKRFEDELVKALERLLEMGARPTELNPSNPVWIEAHRVFVYEVFLYTVAALIKMGRFLVVRAVLRTHYFRAEEHGSPNQFEDFGAFYGYASYLAEVLVPGKKLYSGAAELIKRNADRKDLPFSAIVEADLICFLMSLTGATVVHWYPQMMYYASDSAFPLFVRAAQRRGFEKLSEITGLASADELRRALKAGWEKARVDGWSDFQFRAFRSLDEILNASKWDTIP